MGAPLRVITLLAWMVAVAYLAIVLSGHGFLANEDKPEPPAAPAKTQQS